MPKKDNQLIKVLEKFPDQNPNPVLRFSDKGILLYYNNPSELIINAWKIKINDKPHKSFLDNLKKTIAEGENSFEINIEKKYSYLKQFILKNCIVSMCMAPI